MDGILFPEYVRAGQPRGLKVFSEGLVSPVRVCLPLHASKMPAQVSGSRSHTTGMTHRCLLSSSARLL